jgi:ankyrin repeat protein
MNHRASALFLSVAACTAVAAAPAHRPAPPDALEPARAALRSLQFDQAIRLLTSAGDAGDRDAKYLLGLMYLNGVGIIADVARGRALEQSAAELGSGPAAFVLAAELSGDPHAAPGASRQWLERSAKDGYPRAADALKTGRPLPDRESVGASDPALRTPWIIDCARRGDIAELRRLKPASTSVRDEFGRTALSHAAASGNLASATALLDLGADVQAADQAGVTALMIAAERPDASMLALLLQRGASAQAQDGENRTALFYAAWANQPANIAALREAGASLEARDSRGYNALDAALAVGADAAVTEFRSLGLHANRAAADVAHRTGKFDPAHPGEIYRQWPPLALAISRNDTVTVQQLLAAGGNANTRLATGESMLQIAVDSRALQCLALLLMHGADAAAPDRAGHSVLWRAASRDDPGLVKALLDAGVRPDTHAAAELPPLFAAPRRGRPAVAEALLNAGASVYSTDADGHTPLMLASAAGDAALTRLILAGHAPPDVEDHLHRTALLYAAISGSRETVESLLAAGANARRADAQGATALHAAASQPHAEVLAPLFSAETPLNSRDARGDTALLAAAARGHAEVVKALLERKADPDVQNNAGETALIAASRGGYASVCRLLTAAGANRALRNSSGISAADVARDRGFTAIVQELAGGA